MQIQTAAKSEKGWNRVRGFVRQNKTGYLYLLPFLVIFVLYNLVPVISAITMSFQNYNMLQPASWIGLTNYRDLFLKDDIFILSLKNTFIFALFIGPIGYLLSFLMAWLLNGMKMRRFFALCFYAPSICSGIAMAQVWLYLFSNDSHGLLNHLLMSWGMITTPILWNQNADTIFLCGIIISIWMSMGSGFLVFMAGLQNLNQEVLEQGRVDGIHGRVQELVYLILPMMKPQLLFGAINAIVGSFGVFDVVVQFAGMPTPNYSAHTIVAHLYDYAFNRFQMGYASAIAVVLFLLTFLLGRLCMRLLRSDDE